MSNVIEFKPKQLSEINPRRHFWLSFKELLREKYSETVVHLIVAAIMDRECYERTNDDIRKVVDIYYEHIPSI